MLVKRQGGACKARSCVPTPATHRGLVEVKPDQEELVELELGACKRRLLGLVQPYMRETRTTCHTETGSHETSPHPHSQRCDAAGAPAGVLCVRPMQGSPVSTGIEAPLMLAIGPMRYTNSWELRKAGQECVANAGRVDGPGVN